MYSYWTRLNPNFLPQLTGSCVWSETRILQTLPNLTLPLTHFAPATLDFCFNNIPTLFPPPGLCFCSFSNWLAPSLYSNQLPLHKSLNTLYWPPYKPSPLQSGDNLPLSKRELLSNWPYVFINAFIISPILPGSSIFFAPRAVPGTQTIINKQVLKEGQEMSAQTTPNLFFCPFFTSKILISLGSNSIFFPSKEYSATLYYKDLILCESWPNAYFIHSIHYTCDTAS